MRLKYNYDYLLKYIDENDVKLNKDYSKIKLNKDCVIEGICKGENWCSKSFINMISKRISQ